jgi:small Trp-rich protein
MLFLLLGVVSVALKYFQFGPVAGWSWWVVLSPFALTVAWWAWADASGYTKRKVIERENIRKQERIDRQRHRLGMLGTRPGPTRRR